MRVCIHCPLHITDGGLWTQKSRPGHFAENPEQPLVLSLKPGVGQNIVMVVFGTVTVRYCAVTMHPELCGTVLSPCTQSCAVLCCHHAPKTVRYCAVAMHPDCAVLCCRHAPRAVRYCAVAMHPELCGTVLSPCTQSCAVLCCRHAPRAVRYCAVAMHPELCGTVLSPCTQSCAVLCCRHAPRAVRYCAVAMHPELCGTVLSPCTQSCAVLCCRHAPRAVRYCAVAMHPELCGTVLSPCTQSCAVLCCHHAPRTVPSHEDWNDAEKQTDSDLLTGGRVVFCCLHDCSGDRTPPPSPPPPPRPSLNPGSSHPYLIFGLNKGLFVASRQKCHIKTRLHARSVTLRQASWQKWQDEASWQKCHIKTRLHGRSVTLRRGFMAEVSH